MNGKMLDIEKESFNCYVYCYLVKIIPGLNLKHKSSAKE